MAPGENEFDTSGLEDGYVRYLKRGTYKYKVKPEEEV